MHRLYCTASSRLKFFIMLLTVKMPGSKTPWQSFCLLCYSSQVNIVPVTTFLVISMDSYLCLARIARWRVVHRTGNVADEIMYKSRAEWLPLT
jgi:hypothetical protein